MFHEVLMTIAIVLFNFDSQKIKYTVNEFYIYELNALLENSFILIVMLGI